MNNIDGTTSSTNRSALQASAGCGPLLQGTVDEGLSLRQKIFEHIRASGRAARADITRALAISPGTVTTLTADMIAAGHLREVDGLPREAGRGRPPVALEVVPESRLVVGIKIADRRLTAVLTDFAGNLRADASFDTPNSRKPLDQLVDEVGKLIASLLAKTGHKMPHISGIGIGLSGIIDHCTGVVAWSPYLSAPDQALRQACEERFGVPVALDNDANVLTLAELWFGKGRSLGDFAVVTIEQGVGMGLVLGNRLFRGARGMGLELGHTKVQLDGALCRCGQRGCLEAYLADYALTREAATALNNPPQNLGSSRAVLAALHAEAKSGNHAAETIFQRAGRFLAVGLANVVQLFDPDLIILSGQRMKYDYLYTDDVLQEMQSLTLSQGRAPCPVEINAWDDLIWARGASVLALTDVTAKVLA